MSAIVNLMDAWIKRKEVIEAENKTINDMKIHIEIDSSELQSAILDNSLNELRIKLKKISEAFTAQEFNVKKSIPGKPKVYLVKKGDVAKEGVKKPKQSKQPATDQHAAAKRSYIKSGKYSKNTGHDKPADIEFEPMPVDPEIDQVKPVTNEIPEPAAGQSYYKQKLLRIKNEQEEEALIQSTREFSKIDFGKVKKQFKGGTTSENIAL